MRSVSVSISLVLGGLAHKSNEGCSVAGLIDNDLIQAAFLMFDHFVTYRARLSDSASLSEGLQCLTPKTGRTNSSEPVGLRFGILEGGRRSNETVPTCSFPVSVFTGYSGAIAGQITSCNPARYANNPWACGAGDWSGKFGGMDLGLAEILRNATAPPALQEELKVHYDPMAIPSCLLEGKKLGVFCADGSVAGCTTLKVISKGSPKHGIWAGMKFFSDHAPLGGCQGRNPELPPTAYLVGVGQEGASAKSSRATVTNWWEEVRRKGSGFLKGKAGSV